MIEAPGGTRSYGASPLDFPISRRASHPMMEAPLGTFTPLGVLLSDDVMGEDAYKGSP